MPTGPGFYLRKVGKIFKMEPMIEVGKKSSMECFEWLEWQQQRCPYNAVIKHAYNYGEQIVAGHKVDGYIEIPFEDERVYKVAFQYMGCYWHFCRWQCQKTRATIEDAIEDNKILGLIEKEVDELIVTTSCEWKAEKQRFKIESPNYSFVGQTNITEAEILEKIKSNDFYGILRLDVHTPPSVIAEYEHMNFPLIFRKVEVSENMLSERMKEIAKMSKKKFPDVTRTLTWNAEDIVLTTPTIQFYMRLGMKFSNISWAAQYVPTRPFHKFVKSLVKERIDATKKENKPRGERAKFCLNSCVGRFG